MAISKIKINTDSLSTDADSIGESIGIIEQSISKLEEDYNVLNTMWDGPASEMFRIAYQDDIETLKTIIQNLKKFNLFETNARDKYNNCENEVGSIVSALNR